MGMAAEPQFHVLAVDDSLIDRKLIERLLKSSSFQVTTVDSGGKALEFLGWQKESPSISSNSQQEVEVNLIITDYCMPEMTGYDLLKKVKTMVRINDEHEASSLRASMDLYDEFYVCLWEKMESSSLKNIPVVIMSSENVPSRITRCLEEGAEEFFLKPVRLSDVNRLKPHMLRAKYGQQPQQDMLEDCQKAEAKPSHQQESEQQTEDQQQTLHEQQQQVNQQQNNNKRKPLDEGLSPPDRTRPRYNELTTVV